MKYTINGKTYSNLKAIHRQLELYKYKVKEGCTLNWLDTAHVFIIFKKFGLQHLKGFKQIIVRRRTQGGRVLIAFNEKTATEFHLSVSKVIKKVNFGKVPIKYDSDGDVVMKDV